MINRAWNRSASFILTQWLKIIPHNQINKIKYKYKISLYNINLVTVSSLCAFILNEDWVIRLETNRGNVQFNLSIQFSDILGLSGYINKPVSCSICIQSSERGNSFSSEQYWTRKSLLQFCLCLFASSDDVIQFLSTECVQTSVAYPCVHNAWKHTLF